MKPFVLIACGSSKVRIRVRARYLYVGSLFKSCLRYALTIADEADVYILSAKHGIIDLQTQIDPYNIRFGKPGAIGLEKVRETAMNHGLLSRPCIAVLSGTYLKMTRQIFHVIEAPIAGLQIGYAMQALKKLTLEKEMRI